MKTNKLLVGLLTSVTLVAGAAQAAELSIVSGDTGTGLAFLQSELEIFTEETGHTVTIVPMPSSTSDQFGQYRLEKYGKEVPKTWPELHATAQEIMDAERAEGAADLWGYVFQGNAYEGLTCNALEWVNSYGGGQIIEADGTISINNPQAVAALEEAASWIGTISPEGNLAYMEEESRGVWQLGNAVFMRNWPYAYALSNGDDSAVKGKFDVAPLPAGVGEGAKPSGTLGGWNFAVSRYSTEQEAATELALFLGSAESQKRRAIQQNNLPSIQALYQDADVLEAAPFMATWEEIFQSAVPRPSAPAQSNYNEASSLFWSAVHDTLSGNGSAAENLELLEVDLEDLLN